MKVVRALMQCSLAHQWGDTLYCHLVRLAANMMYVPGATHPQGDPHAPCPSQPMLTSHCRVVTGATVPSVSKPQQAAACAACHPVYSNQVQAVLL